MHAVLPGMIRPLMESRLPDDLNVAWFQSAEEAVALAPKAEIGWFDLFDLAAMNSAIAAATSLKWLNTFYTGVDGFPLDLISQRNILFTNGSGLTAITVAEYAVMAMLTVAKGYREVVRAQDRHEWLAEPPGKVELYGSKALLIGYGTIGECIEERLRAMGVQLTIVRRTPRPDTLGPDEWQSRLGEFDWVIPAVPATQATDKLIGADELAAMKQTATLINISRGSIVDQEALTAALRNKSIGAAFLDVMAQEPLPADNPLWDLDNAHISMHLAGRSQTQAFARAADRFLDNLERYRQGKPLSYLFDLTRGY